MLGLIATRSTNTEVPGIFAVVAHAKQRIINGIPASPQVLRMSLQRLTRVGVIWILP